MTFHVDKQLLYSGSIAGLFFLWSVPLCITLQDSLLALFFSLFLFTLPLWIDIDNIGVDE